MRNRMKAPWRHGWRRRAWIGAVSGLAGGAAFALMQEFDIRAFRNPSDDYLLLGGPFGGGRSTTRRIGIALHAVNSASVGTVYGITIGNLTNLSGPAKGIVFALVENAVLYPAFLMEERHPLIMSGVLPSYRTWTAFTQEVLRHVAFGWVAGAVYSRLVGRRA